MHTSCRFPQMFMTITVVVEARVVKVAVARVEDLARARVVAVTAAVVEAGDDAHMQLFRTVMVLTVGTAVVSITRMSFMVRVVVLKGYG